MPMITGHMLARTLYAATSLGVMDLLDDVPRCHEAMAAATGTDASSLQRLLRALCAAGLAAESAEGRFLGTDLSAPLRRNAQPSLRNLVLMFGAERCWRSWENLPDSLRTGRPASHALYAMTGFEYFQRHPAVARIFHDAMAEATEHVAAALATVVDLSRWASMADIGGGNGLLLSRLLVAAPAARGLLFDLPEALAGASERLHEAGVTSRCDVLAGDFFESIPAGLHVYLMKSVLHDWDDAQCVDILRNLRVAMSTGGVSFIIERLRPYRVECSADHRQTAMMDMNMMVTTGGRERSRAEFVALFEQAGLELDGAPLLLPQTAHYAVLRVRPTDGRG